MFLHFHRVSFSLARNRSRERRTERRERQDSSYEQSQDFSNGSSVTLRGISCVDSFKFFPSTVQPLHTYSLFPLYLPTSILSPSLNSTLVGSSSKPYEGIRIKNSRPCFTCGEDEKRKKLGMKNLLPRKNRCLMNVCY